MKLLLDSNVLLRWADSRAPEHADCMEAVVRVATASNVVYVCAQVMIESYVVATRPTEVNGLGLAPKEAQQFLADIENSSPCLPEPPNIGKLWSDLITRHSVMGRQAHDARLAALMLSQGVDAIITLNFQDFARYPEITPLTPAQILRNS